MSLGHQLARMEKQLSVYISAFFVGFNKEVCIFLTSDFKLYRSIDRSMQFVVDVKYDFIRIQIIARA